MANFLSAPILFFILYLNLATSFAEENGPILTMNGHKQRILSAAFSPDGKKLVSTAYNEVYVWDLNLGTIIKKLGKAGVRYDYAWFGTGSRTILTFSAFESEGAQIWDFNTGGILRQFKENGITRSVRFSPDRTRLATASEESLSMWNAETGEILWRIDRPATNVAFTSDGAKIAYSFYDIVTICNSKTGEILKTLAAKYGGISSLNFTKDNNMLATGHDYSVVFWDIEKSKIVTWIDLRSYDGMSAYTALSPINDLVLVSKYAGWGNSSILYKSLRERVFAFQGTSNNNEAFSPDGQFFATTFLNSIMVWRAPKP